jgi:hypothetical protein
MRPFLLAAEEFSNYATAYAMVYDHCLGAGIRLLHQVGVSLTCEID